MLPCFIYYKCKEGNVTGYSIVSIVSYFIIVCLADSLSSRKMNHMGTTSNDPEDEAASTFIVT